jgi:hypothetical protein
MKVLSEFFETLQEYLANLLIFFRKSRYLRIVFEEVPSRQLRYLQIVFSMVIFVTVNSRDYFGRGMNMRISSSGIHLLIDQLFSGEFLKLVVLWVIAVVLFLKVFAAIFGKTDFEKKVLWNIGFYHLHFMVSSMLFLDLILGSTWGWKHLLIPVGNGYSIHFVSIIAIALTYFYLRIPFAYAKRNLKPVTNRLKLSSYLLLAMIYATLFYALYSFEFSAHTDDFSVHCYEKYANRNEFQLRVHVIDTNHFLLSSGFILQYTGNQDLLVPRFDSGVHMYISDSVYLGVAFSCVKNPDVFIMKKNDYVDFRIQAIIDSAKLMHLIVCRNNGFPDPVSFHLGNLDGRMEIFYKGAISLFFDSSFAKRP